MSPYGTMIAVQQSGCLRFITAAITTSNARTEPTITMFRQLLEEFSNNVGPLASRAKRILVIQFDDRIHHNIGSVAFCRPRNEAPAVRLVPDTYFFLSQGYRSLREAAVRKLLPPWGERKGIVFWRGSATNNGTALDGTAIENIAQIPRVVLCRLLRDMPWTDAAIMAPWGFRFNADECVEYLTTERIFRPSLNMHHQANYCYGIDIDGVASAWGFFEKLLVGLCVLKVGSPFEQWYYGQISEWRHFVPVRADLGDLQSKIEWCLAHPRQAREIAEEGQRFALEHSFETARQITLEALRRSLLIWHELDDPQRGRVSRIPG
jgi:Glycosyl transferase family 90